MHTDRGARERTLIDIKTPGKNWVKLFVVAWYLMVSSVKKTKGFEVSQILRDLFIAYWSHS